MNQPLPITAQITRRHKRWVKGTHFIITLSFFVLTFTGFVILMSHPRLYWGNTGNDLTPALFELPISRNYHHGGWEQRMAFYKTANSPVTAARTFDIFNENGWGRSGHFLAAWFLVVTGLIYFIVGILSGHFRKNLLPANKELGIKRILIDFKAHFKKVGTTDALTPRYGPLQKITYLAVIFILFPIVILTGLTMSPAVTASWPFLLSLFLGAQSARTIHFFASSALLLFLIVHVMMVIKTGFKRNIAAITFGR